WWYRATESRTRNARFHAVFRRVSRLLSGVPFSYRIACVADGGALRSSALGLLIQPLLSSGAESSVMASEACDGGSLSGKRAEPHGAVARPLLLPAALRSDLVRCDPDRVGNRLQRHDA